MGAFNMTGNYNTLKHLKVWLTLFVGRLRFFSCVVLFIFVCVLWLSLWTCFPLLKMSKGAFKAEKPSLNRNILILNL
jgi:hypothetical protein